MHYNEAVSIIIGKLTSAEKKILAAAKGRVVTKSSITYINDNLEEFEVIQPSTTALFGNLSVTAATDPDITTVYSITAELDGGEISNEEDMKSDAADFCASVSALCDKLAKTEDAASVLSEVLEEARHEGEQLVSEMKGSLGKLVRGGIVTAVCVALLFFLLIILSTFLK